MNKLDNHTLQHVVTVLKQEAQAVRQQEFMEEEFGNPPGEKYTQAIHNLEGLAKYFESLITHNIDLYTLCRVKDAIKKRINNVPEGIDKGEQWAAIAELEQLMRVELNSMFNECIQDK